MLEDPGMQRFMFLKLMRYLHDARSMSAEAAKARADSKARLEELTELAKRDALLIKDYEQFLALKQAAGGFNPRLKAAWDSALGWPHVQAMIRVAEGHEATRLAAAAKVAQRRQEIMRDLEAKKEQRERYAALERERMQRLSRELELQRTEAELRKAQLLTEATEQRWKCAAKAAAALRSGEDVDVTMKTPHVVVYDTSYPRDLMLSALPVVTLARHSSAPPPGALIVPALPSCSAIQLALNADGQLCVDGVAVPTPFSLQDPRRRWWADVVPCASRADAVGHVLDTVVTPRRAAAAAAHAAFEDAAAAAAVVGGGAGDAVVYDVCAPDARKQTLSLNLDTDVALNNGTHYATKTADGAVFVCGGDGTPWRRVCSRLELNSRMRIAVL